jgi:polyphosphate kinase 2 (PPK2 family)
MQRSCSHRALPKWRTNKLDAQDRWAVLLIFQAMDAAGKDGVIKHVMSGVDPKGDQCIPSKHPPPKS